MRQVGPSSPRMDYEVKQDHILCLYSKIVLEIWMLDWGQLEKARALNVLTDG